jgi:hypothetical protein
MERGKRLARSKEAPMKKQHLLITVAAVAVAAVAMVALPSAAAAQAPPMGGGYTNVIPIPVDDPVTKAIGGALFKPDGAGPFPAVIYMADCNGVSPSWAVTRQKNLIDHNLDKGVATLIVDSTTARHEQNGWCDRNTTFLLYARQAEDAFAARSVLAAMPDIDAKHIFLLAACRTEVWNFAAGLFFGCARSFFHLNGR